MTLFTSNGVDIIHFRRPWQYSLLMAMTLFTSGGHGNIHFRWP